MKYQTLALTVQKLLVRLKFQRGGQNDRQEKNNMSPNPRSQGAYNTFITLLALKK